MKTILLSLCLAFAVAPGCCKQDILRDVGIEIAEASQVAMAQLERCRGAEVGESQTADGAASGEGAAPVSDAPAASGDSDACEDVERKLDGIGKLAQKLRDEAEK